MHLVAAISLFALAVPLGTFSLWWLLNVPLVPLPEDGFDPRSLGYTVGALTAWLFPSALTGWVIHAARRQMRAHRPPPSREPTQS